MMEDRVCFTRLANTLWFKICLLTLLLIAFDFHCVSFSKNFKKFIQYVSQEKVEDDVEKHTTVDAITNLMNLCGEIQLDRIYYEHDQTILV